jgi:hypothetical protein
MPSRFNLPHFDITSFATTHDYAGAGTPNNSAVRIRDEHGKRIQNELRVALAAADQMRPTDQRLLAPTGTYVEVELRRGTPADSLNMRTEEIRAGATKSDVNGRTIALYVPDHARPVMEQILSEYLTGPLTRIGQNPPNRGKVESIEAIRTARLARPMRPRPFQLILKRRFGGHSGVTETAKLRLRMCAQG